MFVCLGIDSSGRWMGGEGGLVGSVVTYWVSEG